MAQKEKGSQKMKQHYFFYDSENDILSIHEGFSTGETFKGNIDLGGIVLDISTKDEVKGVELLNAHDFLREFFEQEEIGEVIDATFTSVRKFDSFIITLFLKTHKRMIPAKIAIPKQIAY